MRSILAISIASSLTLLSGCGDETEDSNCRYYIQQDLNDQNFDSAITRLESATCQDTYLENEYLIDLASAYLGKSGYSLPNIIAATLEEDDSDGSDAFSNFTSEVSDLQNDDSFEFLKKAQETYEAFLGTDCLDISSKTSTEEGVCLISGVVDLTKAALTVDYLSGDLGLQDSETLDLSTCALEYTLNYSDSTTLAYDCSTTAQVTESEELIFTIPNDDELTADVTKTYQHLTITDGTNTQNFLQTIPDVGFSSIVVANGYCTTDYLDCGEGDDLLTEIDGAACYICPSQSEDEETVNDLVVDALNEGLDNVEDLLSTIVDEDSDLQDAIDDFKSEIGTCDPNTTCTDDEFTLEDIIEYLNAQDSE